jgi:hypothetical protein
VSKLRIGRDDIYTIAGQSLPEVRSGLEIKDASLPSSQPTKRNPLASSMATPHEPLTRFFIAPMRHDDDLESKQVGRYAGFHSDVAMRQSAAVAGGSDDQYDDEVSGQRTSKVG